MPFTFLSCPTAPGEVLPLRAGRGAGALEGKGKFPHPESMNRELNCVGCCLLFTHVILITTLRDRCYCPYFIDGEAEAQKDKVATLRYKSRNCAKS